MKITVAITLITFAAITAQASTAHFSDFRYEGNDEYYRMRPLADSTEFYNPIIPGWNSDPSIVRHGKDYWLVTSTFGYYPGVPLYHSTDLANWELVRNILDRPSQLPHLKGQSLDKGGIYAPQISYNPHNGMFYMITTDVGLKEGHFYVTAKDPRGEWSEPTFLKGIDGIDPSFFFDEDGKSYIVFKEDTAGKPKWSPYRCIRFISFDPVAGNTVGESWPLYEPDVAPDERLDRAEGPHIYKVDNYYYLITAEGGTGTQHSANIYRAPAIRGPWKRSWRNPILTQRNLKDNRSNPVTCAGHADLVQTPEGDWWAVFLAQRPGPAKFQALGRETFLMPVKWSKDGYPYMTQAMDTVPLVLSRPGIKRDDAHIQNGNFTWTDGFTSRRLRPEWFGLRGSTEEYYRTGDGALHLECAAEPATGRGVPAYIGRRIQHHAYKAQATMRFMPDKPTDKAGMLVLKNEANQYFFASDGDNLYLIQYYKGLPTTLAQTAMPAAGASDDPLEMLIECDGTNYKFSYRRPGGEWLILADKVDASLVSCDRTGGFTGATIGFYAVTE